MQQIEPAALWVVYKMTMRGKADGHGVVCEQEEWEAMERASPGYQTLVRAGITNEAEAEGLARETSGFVASERGPRLPSRS